MKITLQEIYEIKENYNNLISFIDNRIKFVEKCYERKFDCNIITDINITNEYIYAEYDYGNNYPITTYELPLLYMIMAENEIEKEISNILYKD